MRDNEIGPGEEYRKYMSVLEQHFNSLSGSLDLVRQGVLKTESETGKELSDWIETVSKALNGETLIENKGTLEALLKRADHLGAELKKRIQ